MSIASRWIHAAGTCRSYGAESIFRCINYRHLAPNGAFASCAAPGAQLYGFN